MANKKAAVEVKQEGDFKIKSKPKKPKQLAIADQEIAKVKIDNTKPEAQGKVIPDIAKVDLTKKLEENAVPESKTTGLSEDKPTGDIQRVDDKARPVQEDAVETTETTSDTPITEIIEEIKEEPVKQTDNVVVDEVSPPQPQLPENIDKLVKFMDETGGTVEDYVKLNRDYSNLDDDSLLKEYYKQSKPHLSGDEINFLIEDKFNFDEEIDEQRDIRRKKLAYKEEIAQAKKDLESLKNKYYADIKQRPGVNQEQQKAVDFFNRYNKQQENIKQRQEEFKNRTNNLFNEEFKGFDYSVGDKKFRYKIQEPSKVANSQVDINNFVGKFLDDKGNINDTAGYHKALYAAMNADRLASHFYEQGKADGVKDIVAKSKNPATEAPRQVAGGDVFVDGLKIRSISGTDSSKLKIKKRTFNN